MGLTTNRLPFQGGVNVHGEVTDPDDLQSSVSLFSGRIPNLDAIRGIAVLFVIWGHLGDAAGVGPWHDRASRVIPDATFGVWVFFVISGFIITLLLLREWTEVGSIDVRAFYGRRFFRLIPALAVYLAAVAAYGFITGRHEPALGWLSTLTFTKNLYAPTWLTGHLWSLSVEEQFYLFWPAFLLLCPARWRVAGAVLLLPLVVLARLVLIPMGRDGFVHASLITNVDFMMAGAVVAFIASNHDIGLKDRRLTYGLLIGSVGLVALNLNLVSDESAVPFQALSPTITAVFLGIGLLALVHIRRGILFTAANAKPVVYFGKLSYSIYLWQQLFLIPEALVDLDLPVFQFPLALLAVLAASVASYEFVERPLVENRKKIIDWFVRRKPQSGVHA